MASDEDRQLYLMLGEMSSDLKSVVRSLDEITGKHDTFEKRLTALEHFKTRALVIYGTLSAAVSIGFTLFLKFLSN